MSAETDKTLDIFPDVFPYDFEQVIAEAFLPD
jgi:hypothetical protein